MSREGLETKTRIMVPFQNDTDFGLGPYDRTRNVLNIQPVIPLASPRDAHWRRDPGVAEVEPGAIRAGARPARPLDIRRARE